MSVITVIIEKWTRNLDLPELPADAEIYNAARPFPAHQCWTGPFVHGIFYGAIYPEKPRADEYRRRAEELDASRLVLVSRAAVEAWGHEYCEKHGVNYGNLTFDEVAELYLDRVATDG